MAKIMELSIILIIIIIIFASPNHANSHVFSSTKALAMLKNEKLTHLHFYFHNLLAGPNVTVEPINKQGTVDFSDPARFFGRVTIANNPLTVDPDLNSTIVGRGQGMYGVSSKTEFALTMVFNFVFTEGITEYGGSTFGLLGHKLVLAAGKTELPVVGGTGVFRYCRGYADVQTYSFDAATGNSVVEYNVYIFHY